MTKETIAELARQLRFTLSEEDTEDILETFRALDSMIAGMEKIDTSNVEEMVSPLPSLTQTAFRVEGPVSRAE